MDYIIGNHSAKLIHYHSRVHHYIFIHRPSLLALRIYASTILNNIKSYNFLKYYLKRLNLIYEIIPGELLFMWVYFNKSPEHRKNSICQHHCSDCYSSEASNLTIYGHGCLLAGCPGDKVVSILMAPIPIIRSSAITPIRDMSNPQVS